MNRKDYHVKQARKFYQDDYYNDFDKIRFVHHSFPEIDYQDIDIKTRILSLEMEQPFFINAMTGGSEWTKKINESLGIIARETNLAIASGSLSLAIDNPKYISSFSILRKTNPHGLIFANIGAGRTVDDAKKAIEIIEADALQIHVNAPQELIYQDGDRHFSSWLKNIEAIVKSVEIPIMVKEVGFGMSQKTIKQLIDIGVKIIDVSGRGGTNFAKIENNTNRFYYLEDFGQSTVKSLLDSKSYQHQATFIASGGIRNPLDIVKSLALGAKAVGVSGKILHLLLNYGIDKTIKEIINWKEELKIIMTLLGKQQVDDLVTTDLIISRELT